MSTTLPEHCPKCGLALSSRESRFGVVWYCPNDACDIRCGADKDGRPWGTPADGPLRVLRMKAHAALDALHSRHTPFMSRQDAYAHLAKSMGLAEEDCHIRYFDTEQCIGVIAWVGGFLHAWAISRAAALAAPPYVAQYGVPEAEPDPQDAQAFRHQPGPAHHYSHPQPPNTWDAQEQDRPLPDAAPIPTREDETDG